MRNIFTFLLFALFITACNQDNLIQVDRDMQNQSKLKTATVTEPFVLPEFCNPSVEDFLVNTTEEMAYGKVSVNNDETNLYVTITANEGYLLWFTSMYAGAFTEIPANSAGVTPSQWPNYAELYGVASHTFIVPLANLDPCFIVAVWAKFRDIETGTIIKETWTMKIPFEKRGGYFDYCLQECKPPCYEEETAWSYGKTFKSLTGTPRWGWYSVYSLGQESEFTLFAGQTHNIGKLIVSDDGVNLTVKYQTTGGAALGLAHLYVGNLDDFKNYINKGGVPVPGKFPYVQSAEPYTSLIEFVIPLTDIKVKDGKIIIAAHAESYLPCKSDNKPKGHKK